MAIISSFQVAFQFLHLCSEIRSSMNQMVASKTFHERRNEEMEKSGERKSF
jgi:hypothetical protein